MTRQSKPAGMRLTHFELVRVLRMCRVRTASEVDADEHLGRPRVKKIENFPTQLAMARLYAADNSGQASKLTLAGMPDSQRKDGRYQEPQFPPRHQSANCGKKGVSLGGRGTVGGNVFVHVVHANPDKHV